MPHVKLVGRLKQLLPFELSWRHLVLRFVIFTFVGLWLLLQLLWSLLHEELLDLEVELGDLLDVAVEDGGVELETDVLILQLLDDMRHLIVNILDLLPSHEGRRRLDVLLNTHVAEADDHFLNGVQEVDDLLTEDKHHLDELNLHFEILVTISGIHASCILHLLLADVSQHEQGSVATLVEQVQLIKRVEVDIFLESWRNDVLNDSLLDFVLPVIVNLPQLLIDVLLLLILNLLNHAVLLLDELRDLRLLVTGVSLSLDLSLQLLDGLLELLDLLPELLVLVLEVEEELLVVNLLSFEGAHLCLLLGELNADFLVELLELLTVAFLDCEDLLEGLDLLLEFGALFFLLQDFVGHFFDHGLVFEEGLVLHLDFGKFLFLSVELFEEDIHVNELLLILLNQFLLTFLIFDLLLHVGLLVLEIGGQTGDCLSQLSVLLLQLIGGQGVQKVL